MDFQSMTKTRRLAGLVLEYLVRRPITSRYATSETCMQHPRTSTAIGTYTPTQWDNRQWT